MDFFSALDTVLNVASKAAPVASAIYNISSGISNNKVAGDAWDTVAGTAAKQDQIATDQWAVNKPLMQKQGVLSGLELDQAIARTPGLLSAQYGLAERGLTQQGKDMDLYDSSRGILSKFFDESEKGIDPRMDMDRAGAAVETAMAGADGQIARSLGRRGVSLGGDQAQQLTQQSIINKVLAKAGARTSAWQTGRDTNYARLSNATNVRGGMGATVDTPRAPSISLGNPAASLAASSDTTAKLAQAASQAAGAAFNEAGYNLTRQY